MGTATKTKASADRLSALVADAAELSEAAEEILRRLADGETLGTGEENILRMVGYDSRPEVERQVGRIETVRAWTARAGSRAEYTAAEKALAEATREHDARRPALEKAIAELQAELDALTQRLEASRRPVDAMKQARERLRDVTLLPPHVAREYERACAETRQPFEARIGELRVAIQSIKALGRIEVGTTDGVQQAIAHCEATQPDILTRHQSEGVVRNSEVRAQQWYTLNREGWDRYVRQRLAEVPKLEAELRDLEEKCRAAVGRAERLRDYYLDRIA
jgi:hypothetical protein